MNSQPSVNESSSNKRKRYHRLSSQIVWRFCLFTVFLSATYGMISFILMYTLEDSFIEKGLQQEARYFVSGYENTGQWPAPRRSNLSLHFTKKTFPDEIQQKAIDEPARKEFYGEEGRHYHVILLENYEDIFLVAEVSGDLLVRPIRGGVIQFLAISGLIVTVIACLIAWLVGRKTAKPLRQLADLVDGVAPEHVPERFAQQYPNNEVGILATTLEQAFVRISKAIERERCFTRDVSHELRTPLAVIKNAVEVYKAKQVKENPDNVSSASSDNSASAARNASSVSSVDGMLPIERIAEAAETMEKTVTTLLMLAREEHTEAHKTGAKSSVSLMPLIEQSIIAHSTLLDGKAVDVHIDDSCFQSVVCHEGMLKVLLDNLLSNAFQYTTEGEVNIAFEDDVLIITDTGPGIDPDISDEVTKPAVKGNQSTGFGFGLAIVSRLCEHQGWQLKVDGSDASKGTKISVRLINKT
ncbi:MAG: two-component sensor histidine kinase [Colwelliaceae bacterium]|nr:two-component sensor histidine kinase [Colwelliaceae bacterium]